MQAGLFSGGHFADTVMSQLQNGTYRGTNWAGNDLELLPLLARCLPGLVVWHGLASPALNGAV